MKLELGLFEAEMLRLRRVQDLLSQSRKRAVSLEETIQALTADYLRRHDPLEKAKRHHVKKGPHFATDSPSPPAQENSPRGAVRKQVSRRVPIKREPIPAHILHQVNLRDQRRCTHIAPGGSRCNHSRWIDIHHKIPVMDGGKNTLDNLITLCTAHHKMWHWQNDSAKASA